ncbi:branched-chain alpha-keto acid dehydrogenase E1 component alpha subunit [Jejuia pallidilutea]|uniref:2-oxoisovalerate dehydrogenase subunit alpha n=1 Tax=Jejuia pallidilutea TaxID=504487 RepID=A0A090WC33_9FLAO|nr:branched-chain alpha-keto acid dehydrogenase E1 component alpha subunit [Jejuia pallidilutea]
MGRREVLTGKAKFGIFGDGKEVPQLAMAKAFKKGDWRSGYYRDQTFMMAIGELTVEQFFAGLYANTNLELEPMSAGRQMGGHFVTHSIDENGNWKDLTKQYNSSADISPTAGQMPRLLGLAQASKVFKELKDINAKRFSVNGNEVAWGTIGNASTSEGLFFETINAAGVLQVPMVTSIWDDEYGISVHAKYQTTKENISEILKGFQRDKTHKGFEILRVKGWDYANLIETYQEASIIAREEHVPVLIHVTELTQPQGHSTSGSHERYKSGERLQWESAHDCNKKMREWIIESGIATNETLTDIERTIKREVKQSKTKAWNTFLAPIKKEQKEIIDLLEKLAKTNTNGVFISKLKDTLAAINEPTRKDILSNARKAIRYTIGETSEESTKLKKWINKNIKEQQPEFSSHLFCETDRSALNVSEVKPIFDDASELVDGRIIIRDNFDTIFNKYPETLIFGEDTGNIGDVTKG